MIRSYSPKRTGSNDLDRLNITCASLLALTLTTTTAFAAPCGNTGAGFEGWKADFATEAKKAGVKQKGLAALASATYATKNNRCRSQSKVIQIHTRKIHAGARFGHDHLPRSEKEGL